jgi:hypothetical protein
MTTAYRYRAHPTVYADVRFRSRLEARWAAFFDLARWRWEYEPIDLVGWSPDFHVEFDCGHSECGPTHELYVEVKPYHSLDQFADHACMKINEWEVPSPAAFGLNPRITRWVMAHGAGGGEYDVGSGFADRYGNDVDRMWRRAGNRVQWRSR